MQQNTSITSQPEFVDLQRAHWVNVRAILRTADALFALLEPEGDPPKQEVLRVVQDLVRDMKIKWQKEN